MRNRKKKAGYERLRPIAKRKIEGSMNTPAAGTPRTRVRPWKQRHTLTEKGALPIDLPSHLCDPTGARADGENDAVPASYPRGVLRGERPKRVLVSFARSKETPSG